MEKKVSVLMVGTGEYTTGFVHNSKSDSDKGAGVVALTMFDLRAKGKINRLLLCGVNGKKFPAIRQHMQEAIGNVYSGLSIDVETYPRDDEIHEEAYLAAMDTLVPGDAVIIFTPDDTHFKISMAAIERGLHVLVTKPAVQSLEDHRALHEAAQQKNVLVAIEVHKRWDPIYTDARDRIKNLGPFSYIYSYMSQPKHQLHTFKSWAGKSSDISYYLNSHHIDFHEWCLEDNARPVLVQASASTGVASNAPFNTETEDTITLMVTWENLKPTDNNQTIEVASTGTAVYTSSWVAPKSDVHSQQRFFYMGQKGEVTVDQAHRGYSVADDSNGYKSVNPLFMKYTPTDGKFSGQLGYGYRSFDVFIDAVLAVNNNHAVVSDYDHSLASIATTYKTTAILRAGRIALDNNNRQVKIEYQDPLHPCRPTNLTVI